MLVDRAPQIPQPAVDPDEHLVEVPRAGGARAPPAQRVGAGRPELGAPPPDRLVAHRDTAYQHRLLDLTKAQREPKVQSHAVVDDLNRVAAALLRRRCGAHPTNPPSSPTLTNVTVPSPHTSGRDGICSARPNGEPRWPTASQSGVRSPRPTLPPEYERPNGVPSRLLQTQLRHYTFQST